MLIITSHPDLKDGGAYIRISAEDLSQLCQLGTALDLRITDLIERSIFSGPAGASPLENLPGWSSLSVREKRVATLAAHGLRNKEIAEVFDVGDQTIKNQLHDVFEKLSIKSRTQLVLARIQVRREEPIQNLADRSK